MSFKYKVLGNVNFGNEIEDILKLKGITDIKSFLNPTVKNTESELLFDNIDKARDILTFHIEQNNIIDLIVDCDVDGYTSAANIYQYIKRIKPSIQIRYFIHKGKIHGLSEFVEEICKDDSKLVIVPDAGTGDVEECKLIKSYNKDIIVLDHHSISADGNPAIVVNNQLSKKITNKSMTGVGITYKFTKVLDRYYGVNYADDYLDLVALGMIGDRADTMNLETRYLILEGLKQIINKTNKNKLINVLINAQMYSMNYKIKISSIGFYICPLINSLIRLGSYEDKTYLFESLVNSDKMLTRHVKGKGMISMTIQEYVLKSCQSSNRQQKKITEESACKLSDDIEKYKMDKLPIIVCNAKENVDVNSTGLIANRLADQYQRPCLLMRRKGNVCKGSGRGSNKCGIEDFNKWCKDTELFNMVEGHPNSFGCEISFDNTNKLFQLLYNMPKIDEPTYCVYNVYDVTHLHDQIIKNVAKYDYVWGNTVEPPLFLIKNVPCNKYNVSLNGARQNRIEFFYHNIKFIKQTKGSSLVKLYKEIISVGENIEFDIVGEFSIDKKTNKTPLVIIEDMTFKKSYIKQGFGF